MSAFGGLIMTNKGRILQTKAQTGVQLTFTRIALGDGSLSGQSILELNQLINEKKSLSITKLKTQPDGKAVVGAVLSNQDITTGFYFREIGVFAQDPDVGEILYCYGNAGATAEYIPAGGGPDIIEKNIDIITIVGNASNVTAVINQSMVYETPEGAQQKADEAEENAKDYTNQRIASLTAADVGAVSTETFNAHSADYVKHPAYAVASGSANTYTVTLNPAPTSYVEGMAIAVKINVNNTGASTINVNGLGAVPIKKPNGNDVSAGNLKAGSIYTLRYNGSNFILQGEGGSGNAQPSDVLSGKTFTNDSGEQVGTMPNRGAYNITPGTSNITIPAGYHNGSGVVYGDPDLIPSNIRQGVSIFGVTGTLIEGKRWASGVTTGVYESSPGKTYITVRGLAFSPNIVVAKSTTTTWYGENILFAVYANKTSFSTQPPNSVNVYADNSTSARVGEFIKYSDGFKIAVWPGSIIGYDMSWIAIE